MEADRRAQSARPRGMSLANSLREAKGGACPPFLRSYVILITGGGPTRKIGSKILNRLLASSKEILPRIFSHRNKVTEIKLRMFPMLFPKGSSYTQQTIRCRPRSLISVSSAGCQSPRIKPSRKSFRPALTLTLSLDRKFNFPHSK